LSSFNCKFMYICTVYMYRQYSICIYSTICRRAFYASSVQLGSLGTRLDTQDIFIPYLYHIYIYIPYLYHMSLLSPRHVHVVQHDDINASKHAQSEWGPSAQTTTREVSFALSLIHTH
jgi:hypothetical protein